MSAVDSLHMTTTGKLWKTENIFLSFFLQKTIAFFINIISELSTYELISFCASKDMYTELFIKLNFACRFVIIGLYGIIVKSLDRGSSNLAFEIHFPAEFSSNSDQTHLPVIF